MGVRDSSVDYFLPRNKLASLFEAIAASGMQLTGPVVASGAIQYLPITDVNQLPQGWHDEQAPGEYRLSKDASKRQFAWANGPQALKPFVFASRDIVWWVEQQPDGQLKFSAPAIKAQKTAILGVRSCDLAALALQDQHFLYGDYPDPSYQARRENLFLIAVNCSHPADTCFCVSTGDGPAAKAGYDMVLTELDDGYLIGTGSAAGLDMLALLTADLKKVKAAQRIAAKQQLTQAVACQTGQLPTGNLQAVLFSQIDNPMWQQVADQCLACGNCTQVCPTCFCHKEEDQTALGDSITEHVREWDSCFSDGHGYMAGHQARPEIAHRYRQWMTHKLGSWHEQYGRSGCVGCGRCTTWCPVGIDFVKIAQAICGEIDEESCDG
jgi:sulfhydrogenase subunit beta (sulfur reductase)